MTTLTFGAFAAFASKSLEVKGSRFHVETAGVCSEAVIVPNSLPYVFRFSGTKTVAGEPWFDTSTKVVSITT